jgi:hypothetical protein
MESLEFYSKGLHGSVYRVSKEQKLVHPDADLVKIAITDNQPINHPLAIYYRHQMAQLLFPNNFIDVVGVKFTSYDRSIHFELFSKLAPVNPDHAVFSAHMDYYRQDNDKDSRCKCEICARHRGEHGWRSWFKNRNTPIHKMKEIGIFPDTTDPSDYCYTPNGVLFFELEGLEPKTLQNHLDRLKNPSEEEQKAGKLLTIYKEVIQG